MASTGCEFGPCTIQSTQEVCNGADDNCNGMTDEGVSLPPVSALKPTELVSPIRACTLR